MLIRYKYVIFFLFLMTISGCGNDLNLEVKSTVPTPLANQLPLDLGIYYNDNFKNFIFKEDSEARGVWTIDSRASRMALFNDILPTMFKSVNPIEDVNEMDILVDVILEPEVMDMQVALPEETQSDMYEAWIKYTIKMYTPDGKLITQWQITGYGKTHTALFKNKERGLNMAINLALRDLGAKMVLDFPRVPGVKNWLTSTIDCSTYSNLCQ